MKRNIASQSVGAQIVSSIDGTAFTGAVTVYVTGDNGVQAIGTVASGVCTHEGSGYHSYAPSAAETNYEHIAFTFTGTSAIPTTVQLYTMFSPTGDCFVRLGAPVGASISVDVAAVQADTDNLQARIPAALVSGRIDSSVGAMAADTVTASALASDAVTEIQAGLSTLNAAGVRTAVGLASANLDTQFDALPTNAELATALATADDAVLAAVTALTGATVPITSNVKTNQALANFAFLMTHSTTHAPTAGLTVTCTRSIDGGVFAAGTLANVAEIGNGLYKVDFGAGDLNGKVVTLRAIASGADDVFATVVTQP